MKRSLKRGQGRKREDKIRRWDRKGGRKKGEEREVMSCRPIINCSHLYWPMDLYLMTIEVWEKWLWHSFPPGQGGFRCWWVPDPKVWFILGDSCPKHNNPGKTSMGINPPNINVSLGFSLILHALQIKYTLDPTLLSKSKSLAFFNPDFMRRWQRAQSLWYKSNYTWEVTHNILGIHTNTFSIKIRYTLFWNYSVVGL